jgi:predicted metal-dependent hydrolase
MRDLKYLTGYPQQVTSKVSHLIAENRLGSHLLGKYPLPHEIRTDRALYDFALAIKHEYLRSSEPLSKVSYDNKIHVINHALGSHTFISRVQGVKLKAKREIRIAAVFRQAPLDLLRMIMVHELAHLKEKEHCRAFYQLCEHMEPAYHQLEFDMRLFLTQVELAGPLYQLSPVPVPARGQHGT